MDVGDGSRIGALAAPVAVAVCLLISSRGSADTLSEAETWIDSWTPTEEGPWETSLRPSPVIYSRHRWSGELCPGHPSWSQKWSAHTWSAELCPGHPSRSQK